MINHKTFACTCTWPQWGKRLFYKFQLILSTPKIRLRIIRIKQNLLKLEDVSEGFANFLSAVGVGSTCGGQLFVCLKCSPRTIFQSMWGEIRDSIGWMNDGRRTKQERRIHTPYAKATAVTQSLCSKYPRTRPGTWSRQWIRLILKCLRRAWMNT